MWFGWYKWSYSGEKVGCGACGRTTMMECEDGARILEQNLQLGLIEPLVVQSTHGGSCVIINWFCESIDLLDNEHSNLHFVLFCVRGILTTWRTELFSDSVGKILVIHFEYYLMCCTSIVMIYEQTPWGWHLGHAIFAELINRKCFKISISFHFSWAWIVFCWHFWERYEIEAQRFPDVLCGHPFVNTFQNVNSLHFKILKWQ